MPLAIGADLLAKARKGGSAGSPDSWTGGEISTCLRKFSKPLLRSPRSGLITGLCWPSSVSLLTPGGHLLNQTVPVDKLRPITVMSSWWRLWVSTLYHSDAFQVGMRSVLTPEVCAITGEDIYATLIRISEQLSEQGMVLHLTFPRPLIVWMLGSRRPCCRSMGGPRGCLGSSSWFGCGLIGSSSFSSTRVRNP